MIPTPFARWAPWFLAALLGTGCASYRSTSTSSWVEKTHQEQRVLEVMGVEQVGPTQATIRALHVGGEPALEVACEALTAVRARMEIRTVPYRERRHARATLLVKNALNENLLVYGLGWIVLAPLWVPIQYQIRAHGAASEATGSMPGVETVEVGDNECIVEVWEERVADEEGGTRQEEESVLHAALTPLRYSPMEVRSGGEVLQLHTDGAGRLSIPLRWLVGVAPAGGSFEIVNPSRTEVEGAISLSLLEERIAKPLEAALGLLLTPPPPVEGARETLPREAAKTGDAMSRFQEMARTALEDPIPGARWTAASKLPRTALLLRRPPPIPPEALAALDSTGEEEEGAVPGPSEAATAVAKAPWWDEAHLILAEYLRQSGQLDAALLSLSMARSLVPEGSDEALRRAALFTTWAAGRQVEVIRGGAAGETEGDLKTFRDRMALAPTTPAQEVTEMASKLGLVVESTTFGATPLGTPPIFLPGWPSGVLRDPDGRPFFWRFTPR